MFLLILVILFKLRFPSVASGIFQTDFKLSGKEIFTQELRFFKAFYFSYTINLYLT